MQNKTSNGVAKKSILRAMAFCLLAVVLCVSYVVALAKLSSPVSFDEETSTVSEVESSLAVSEVSEESKISISKEYKYYNKLNFKDNKVANSEVVNGSLSVIDGTKGYPGVGESTLVKCDVVNIYAKMTRGAYGLSGSNLVLYDDALQAIDDLAVWFNSVLPSNGLGIDKAYTDPRASSLAGKTTELASGYSVQFMIYRSGYKFTDNEYSALREQSHIYGLIQRYPEGKKEYTGYDADYSIYRYVGLAHSDYMQRYKLSLEEYLDKIRTEQIIEFKARYESDSAYVVYYVPLDTKSNSTKIPLPTGGEQCIVSGDGKNGFIVTVKVSA